MLTHIASGDAEAAEYDAQQMELDKSRAPFGWIYFVQAEDGGPIKIGRTHNPSERFKGLQNSCPHKLVMRRKVRVPSFELNRVESEFHLRFGHLRLHGEWFRAAPDLANVADAIADGDLEPNPGFDRLMAAVNSVPSAQARPTSTSEMRRDRPEQRDAPESDEAARASSRSTVTLGGVAIQMDIQECIAIAERECLDAPCYCPMDCDRVGECLAAWIPDSCDDCLGDCGGCLYP